jgi:hypothetical protein
LLWNVTHLPVPTSTSPTALSMRQRQLPAWTGAGRVPWTWDAKFQTAVAARLRRVTLRALSMVMLRRVGMLEETHFDLTSATHWMLASLGCPGLTIVASELQCTEGINHRISEWTQESGRTGLILERIYGQPPLLPSPRSCINLGRFLAEAAASTE